MNDHVENVPIVKIYPVMLDRETSTIDYCNIFVGFFHVGKKVVSYMFLTAALSNSKSSKW